MFIVQHKLQFFLLTNSPKHTFEYTTAQVCTYFWIAAFLIKWSTSCFSLVKKTILLHNYSNHMQVAYQIFPIIIASPKMGHNFSLRTAFFMGF
jgi:hypothetical protein